MKTIKTTVMPVDLLWNYREFNRIAKPAPIIPLFHMTNVHDLRRNIAKNGIEKPVELSIYQGKALLTDGNHRIGVCKISNTAQASVNIVIYENEKDLADNLPETTIRRFRKINPELDIFLS